MKQPFTTSVLSIVLIGAITLTAACNSEKKPINVSNCHYVSNVTSDLNFINERLHQNLTASYFKFDAAQAKLILSANSAQDSLIIEQANMLSEASGILRTNVDNLFNEDPYPHSKLESLIIEYTSLIIEKIFVNANSQVEIDQIAEIQSSLLNGNSKNSDNTEFMLKKELIRLNIYEIENVAVVYLVNQLSF